MALSKKQSGRLQGCLEEMQKEPFNPADIAGIRRDLKRSVEASKSLAFAVHASRDGWGAEEVNGALDKAEAVLGRTGDGD